MAKKYKCIVCGEIPKSEVVIENGKDPGVTMDPKDPMLRVVNRNAATTKIVVSR